MVVATQAFLVLLSNWEKRFNGSDRENSGWEPISDYYFRIRKSDRFNGGIKANNSIEKNDDEDQLVDIQK